MNRLVKANELSGCKLFRRHRSSGWGTSRCSLCILLLFAFQGISKRHNLLVLFPFAFQATSKGLRLLAVSVGVDSDEMDTHGRLKIVAKPSMMRVVQFCISAPAFPRLSNFQISNIWNSKNICFPKMDSGFFLNYLKYLGVSKVTHNWFGSHGHVQNPKIMNMMGFQVFPKWNRKVTCPKWSRIILRSLMQGAWIILTVRLMVCDNLEYGINVKKHEMKLWYWIWDQYLSKSMKSKFGNMGSISIKKHEIDILWS